MLGRRTDQVEMKKRVSRAGEVGRGQTKCKERARKRQEVPVQSNCKFGYDSSWKRKEHTGTQATSNCKESQVLGGNDLMRSGLKAVNCVFSRSVSISYLGRLGD